MFQKSMRVALCGFVMAIIVVTTVWAGGKKEQAAAPDELVNLRVFRGGVTYDYDTDPVIQEIERRMNVNIEFLTSGWGEIAQVRNLFLGAGENVDIVHHMDLNRQWINDEVIIPLNRFISEGNHPYLYRLTNSETFLPLQRDGDIYYVPMVAHGSDWGWAVRTDWMDEAGLPMPRNEEDLRNILRAFRARDPGGSIVGWQLEGSAQIRRSLLPILAAFGVPTSFYDVHANFINRGGRLEPIAVSNEVRDALRFMNSLYRDGLVNTDFPSMSSFPMMHEQYFLAARAGLGWMQNPPNQAPRIAGGGEVGTIQPFSARGKQFTRAVGIVNNGQISITSASRNPQRAIDLLEFLNSLEGRRLLTAGVPGLHYTTFDVTGRYFDRNTDVWTEQFGGDGLGTHPLYFYFGQGLVHGYIPAANYPTFEEALDNIVFFDPIQLKDVRGYNIVMPAAAEWAGDPNPYQFVVFPELDDIRAEIADTIVVGWTRAISAQTPAAFDQAWTEFTNEWNRVGGARWVARYQQYYDEELR